MYTYRHDRNLACSVHDTKNNQCDNDMAYGPRKVMVSVRSHSVTKAKTISVASTSMQMNAGILQLCTRSNWKLHAAIRDVDRVTSLHSRKQILPWNQQHQVPEVHVFSNTPPDPHHQW